MPPSIPLISYGLRFIINADFIVPSSREAVDVNSAWNQMLRQRVPGLFLQVWGGGVDISVGIGVAGIRCCSSASPGCSCRCVWGEV